MLCDQHHPKLQVITCHRSSKEAWVIGAGRHLQNLGVVGNSEDIGGQYRAVERTLKRARLRTLIVGKIDLFHVAASLLTPCIV